MRIIVNADDFGKDENATRAILESLDRGYISQTTLMVNMPYAEEAVRLAKEHGHKGGVGLHITLTEGFPLTEDIRHVSRFCDKDGRFLRDGLRTNIWFPYSGQERMALHQELDAQIQRFMDYGLQLLHCDGHHHVHLWLPVYYVLIPLLRKYRFHSIRRCVDMPWEKVAHPHIRGWGAQLIRSVLYRGGLYGVDHFGSVEFLERRFCHFSNEDTIEYMVHPRYNANSILVDYKTDDGVPMAEVSRTIQSHGCKFLTYSVI